ncbi:helix-turn-helix domain-containing protein [Brevibacillus borstelensis]|jgi:DNA-binding PucR family transcriptional regulator
MISAKSVANRNVPVYTTREMTTIRQLSRIYPPLSFGEAKKAVRYLQNRNRHGVVRYGDLGVNQLLIHQSPEDQEAFVRSVFQPLWEKKEKYSDLEKTLLVYVHCHQSAHLTAKQLHIHINTLYQRLRKIEELLAIDLKQPEDKLKIQLACHLRSE